MQPNTNKRFYSPQFSALSAVSVRRLAWALSKPMPATVDIMVQLLPHVLNSAKVCQSCRDKSKCADCAFCNSSQQLDPAVLENVV